jgi:predicted nucleic acid-binding protein
MNTTGSVLLDTNVVVAHLRNDPDLTTRLRATPAIFSGKAEERGIQLSELLTEVLKRDIEINEALK